MSPLHITDIESAINFWRCHRPSSDGFTLGAETRVLAEVYARMVFEQVLHIDAATLTPDALAAWLTWYDSTPDTPCIAICSTSQGDDECKGCGRSFAEVQRWLEMSPVEKRDTWHRITQGGTAWRFNRYAERATEKPVIAT